MRFTQRLQLMIQQRVISRVLASHERPKPPLSLKLFGVFPILRRIPARLMGVGIRPEHVQTPEGDARFGCEPRAVPSARERLGVDAERVARHPLNRVGFGDLRPNRRRTASRAKAPSESAA